MGQPPAQGAMGQSVGSLYGQQFGSMGENPFNAPTPPAFGQSTPSTAQTGIGQLFSQQSPAAPFQGQNAQAPAQGQMPPAGGIL